MDQLYTFGAEDEDVLQSYLPQISLGGTLDVYTSARVTTAIDHAASRVCAVYASAGMDLAAINADTTSIAYVQAQRLVCLIAVPQIIGGISGLGIGVEDTVRDYRDEARDIISRLQARPEDMAAGGSAAATSQVYATSTDTTNSTTPARQWQSTASRPVRW